MDLRQRRMDILRRVEAGELDPEDGNRLLLELEERAAEGEPVVAEPAKVEGFQAQPAGMPAAGVTELVTPVSGFPEPPLPDEGKEPNSSQPAEEVSEPPKSGGWLGLWVVPFLLGLLLTLFSVNWMYQGWITAGLSWGFWLSFIPFAIGVLLMWAGWEMRLARWLHLRIRQKPGERPQVIAFSLPLPIGLTRWAIQRFGHYTPFANGRDSREVLDELDQAFTADGPTHIFVDDEDGEQVEIWIDGPTRH
jgi:hypothetical protein